MKRNADFIYFIMSKIKEPRALLEKLIFHFMMRHIFVLVFQVEYSFEQKGIFRVNGLCSH